MRSSNFGFLPKSLFVHLRSSFDQILVHVLSSLGPLLAFLCPFLVYLDSIMFQMKIEKYSRNSMEFHINDIYCFKFSSCLTS